jgi:hypothetical protein
MSDFRKSLIACFVVASFVIAPLQTFAWQCSGCGGCNGSYFYTCADRFCDKVDSFPGWSQQFCLGCSSCSEDYYKSSSYGGSENSWVDSTDIHFRNSHCGTAWDSYWGKYLSSIPCTDGSVTPGEARRAWGDYDLEWMASKCCSLLRNDSKAYWYTTFDGLHLMLGFKTSSYGATNFGRKWANRMKKTTFLWWTWDGQTITQAWFNTTDETQPSGTTARVLAEVYNNYNDHLWGQGYVSSDPTYNGWYWYWDHVAGSPDYIQVNSLGTMNVYRVVPRKVDEEYVQNIGRAFGLTGEVGDLCDSFVMVDFTQPLDKKPKVLKVSKTSGQFYFQNQGKLFAANPDAGQFPPEQAAEAARNFLNEFGLLPQDAGDFTVEFDTLTEESEQGEIKQQLFQNTNVVFARQLPGDPAGGQRVSVAGAGARLKVYLYDDGQHGEVIGAMGNWRNVEVMGSIQVNGFDKTWSFFDKYREALSPAKAQVVYNRAVPISEEATQGYYEHPGFAEQQELIPCWIIPVEYYQDDILVLKADTFVPAAEGYFPPVVEILKPAEFETFNQGETVVFDCRVEEGFGTEPYSYNWESDVDGVLSTQKSFQTDLLSVHCPDMSCDCRPLPHTISLTVTDAKGSVAEDFVVITIKGECDECTDCADLDRSSMVDLKDLAIYADRYLNQTGHTGPR